MGAFIWGIGIRRLIDAIRRETGARRRLPWHAAEPEAAVVSAEDQVLAGIEHGRLGQVLAALSRTATCCCPTRQVRDDRDRGRTRAPGTDASARAGDDGRSGVTPTRAPRLRTVLGLARVEAWLLVRSLPATAATRTLAHLVGLAGAVSASVLLAGAATAVVQARGAIGTPDVAVLAGGLLLVIAAGAAGIAIGSRFPHPLTIFNDGGYGLW